MRMIEVYEPVFSDVLCPEVGPETARDGFCVSCGSTTHEVLPPR